MAEKFDKYEEVLGEPRFKVSGSSVFTYKGSMVKISGSGSLEDGILRASGSCSIEGFINVKEIHISGSFRAEDGVKAEYISVSGSAKFGGEVSCNSIRVSGSCSINGPLKADEAKFSGSSKISDDVRGQLLNCSGSFKAENLNLNSCSLSGAFSLNSVKCKDMFKAYLRGKSRIRDGLTARIISIRGKGGGRSFKISVFGIPIISVTTGNGEGELEVGYIKGEDIYIECTKCERIEGVNVNIGPHCIIRGDVIYTSSFSIDPTSKVLGKVIRSE